MKFESRKQKDGEKFDNFYLALTELSEIADLCGNCKEQRIVVRIQEGLRVRDLARTLSQTTFPTLTQALDFCRAAEAAENSDEKRKSRSVNRITSGYSKSISPNDRRKSRSRDRNMNRSERNPSPYPQYMENYLAYELRVISCLRLLGNSLAGK